MYVKKDVPFAKNAKKKKQEGDGAEAETKHPKMKEHFLRRKKKKTFWEMVT